MEVQDRVDSYEGTEKHELILMLVQAEDEVDDLRARIAELERCVVMGGDGPIELGQERWYWDDGEKKKESFIVESYTALLLGDTYLNPDTICIEPDRTYSSPDSVPEGGKE